MATQSQSLPEYERKRLENIKRNAEMMASLKLQSKALELSSETKRNRNEMKGYKTTPRKKPKTQTPIVIRRSLRTQGLAPDGSTAKGLDDDLPYFPHKTQTTPIKSPVKKLGPLSMKESCVDDSFDRSLIDTVLDMKDNAPLVSSGERGLIGSEGSLDLDSMVLKTENVARVMSGKVYNLKFFPCNDRLMVVAGNKFGNVAFWDVDCNEGENEGIYLYQPHTAPVSGFSIHPHSISKVFSSGYDGLIRLLDFEKESFGLVYSSDDTIFSLTQRSQDADSLYFSEANGLLNVWDTRAGKLSSSHSLHDYRINSIDFNPENPNLIATGSTDGTACIWDIRQMDAGGPKNLKIVQHKRSVHGAYFSPGGSCLATTSFDNHVGIHSGADFNDTSMIYHNNHTGRWISSFRAIWGWDDAHIFIGSMERKVDVISVEGNTRSLWNSNMSAIPCRLATHPYKVGTLAAATSGGQIYLWTQN